MAGYGGIDLGGTKIQAVIVDSERTVLGSARRATPTVVFIWVARLMLRYLERRARQEGRLSARGR